MLVNNSFKKKKTDSDFKWRKVSFNIYFDLIIKSKSNITAMKVNHYFINHIFFLKNS